MPNKENKGRTEEHNRTNRCIWFFGSGASIENGFEYKEPEERKKKDRNERVMLIHKDVSAKMQKVSNVPIYKELLLNLASYTSKNWQHLFCTTNWDYLLQREIDRLFPEKKPPWLNDNLVFHLNGTVEPHSEDSVFTRQSILLPDDPLDYRKRTIETNIAFTKIFAQKMFVVVGMSLNYEIDRILPPIIEYINDGINFGPKWLIVNKCKNDFNLVDRYIKDTIRGVTLLRREEITFEKWLKNGMQELQREGVLIST